MRDYDREPVVVRSNLFPMVFRAMFVVFFCILIGYVVFLSGMVDWSAEDKTFMEIFIEEANKNHRFAGIFVFLYYRNGRFDS